MNNIFQKCVDKNNLLTAWQFVKAKGKAGGIDSVTIEKFDLDADRYMELLYRQLQDDVYVPEPYRTIQIPKNDTDFRKLGLPTVKDKIVQVAVKQIIEPIFDKKFLNVSYGYRNGKGPLKAIKRISHRISDEKRQWVTIADIDNYFDSIKPEILYPLIEKEIQSPQLMRLIKLWIQIGSFNFRQKYEPYLEGVPQGCILSPLFSNIYLHQFDSFMVENGYGLVRYADDFLILSHTEKEAYAAFKHAKHFLENNLKLALNNNWKVKKAKNGFEFLHITFTGHKTGISEERFYHLVEKLENAIEINDATPTSIRIQQTINGIKAYYGKLIPEKTLEKLDEALGESLVKKILKWQAENKLLKKTIIDDFLLCIDFFSHNFKSNKAEKIAKIKKNIALQKTNTKLSNTHKDIEKDIEKKREQYQNLANKNSELVLATPGIFVGKNHKGITIKEFGVQKQTIPTNTLKAITILSNSISLSGKVIEWCSHNNIPIDFIGFDGQAFAKIITPKYPDTSISLAQLKALENDLGIALIKKIVTGKIKNQLGLIKYYYKYRKERDADYAEVFEQRIKEMENTLLKIKLEKTKNLDDLREILMGYEGHAAACYWDMMIRLLNDYTVFERRERQGATDLVNCLLNYGYGILYSRVWQAISRRHLNPCISFLHKPTEGKPTLAFDLIEEFRQQAVDKVVFALITKGENVSVSKGVLTPDTKKRLVEKVLERLNNTEKFRGQTLTLAYIIELQADLMVQHILGKAKYKPYVAKW